MDISIDDYIVIIISREKPTETALLKRLNNGGTIDEWCYVAIKSDCNHKLITPERLVSPDDLREYQFFLINTKCYKIEENHKNNCSLKIDNLIKTIKTFHKNVILWTHQRDEIQCETIQKVGDFDHGTEHPAEVFMQKICNSYTQITFMKEFEGLIKYSLKKKLKPLLIALSYLCWGYLAAQGKIDLPEKPSISKNKKAGTIGETWWEHVLKKEKESFLVDVELEAISNKIEVKRLIDIIKNGTPENSSYFKGKTLINGKEAAFTEIVSNAYKNLSEILEGNL